MTAKRLFATFNGSTANRELDVFHFNQLVMTHDCDGKQREAVIASTQVKAPDDSGRLGYLVCFGDYASGDKKRVWRPEHKITRR